MLVLVNNFFNFFLNWRLTRSIVAFAQEHLKSMATYEEGVKYAYPVKELRERGHPPALVKDADVILGYDTEFKGQEVIFGRALLEKIVDAGEEQRLTVLAVK